MVSVCRPIQNNKMKSGKYFIFLSWSFARMPFWNVQGISTAGNHNDARYVVDPLDYPYFVSLFERGSCAGAIVGKRHVVTAAHCFCQDGAYKSAVGTKTILSDSSSVFASRVHYNPDCPFDCGADGPNRCDVAVLEYNSDIVGDSVPLELYKWNDEVGKRITILGYGNTGDAGDDSCIEGDGKFRRAHNIVTAAEQSPGGIIKYVMDDPNEESGALSLEGLAQSGDSGGPAIITRSGKNYLAGANSGTDESNPCDYGSVDQYCRISAHHLWIYSAIAGSADGNEGGASSTTIRKSSSGGHGQSTDHAPQALSSLKVASILCAIIIAMH